MYHLRFKLYTIVFVVAMLCIAPVAALQAAPIFQDATPTPAAEEEAETEEATEETETEEVMEEAESADTTSGDEDLQLVTAKVAADLVQPGRVLMSARGNHWVYDSVPPINGPNEEVNPLDGMLTALIACGMYIYEAVGIEQEIALDTIAATVQGQLDPRGVAGVAVNPRVRGFTIMMSVTGDLTPDDAAMMTEAFSTRCPIYTTLALSAPITVTNEVNRQIQEPITTQAEPIVETDIEGEELELAGPAASGRMIEFGRSVMSARGNHWIFDSVPPINGPNEEVNPLDGMLTALIACGMYIYEAVGIEEGITTDNLSATVTGQLDARGVAGAAVNPRVRVFDVTMNVDGPTVDEAAMLAESFSQRCPIYTTLARSAPISVTNVVDSEAQEPIATAADPIVDHDIPGEELELGMPTASGRMIEFGRSVMSARGNHWIFDSVPPINGPNEEVNPLDALVGALPACGVM
ncbi:MAG: OsmC family protein, partial [Caldilineaceae bacterium]|nr:OsmC family protein [Caldilineaceae bacterium]